MKLTLHQEKIIEAIISKDVYDIPSYLEYFQKSHIHHLLKWNTVFLGIPRSKPS